MANDICVSSINPWDLSFVISGKRHSTLKPKWADVIEMAKTGEKLRALQQAKNPDEFAGLEADLRAAVRRFFDASVHTLIDGMEYDDLMSAFMACQTYYQEWLKKKQLAAVSSAEAAAGVETAEAQKTPMNPSRPSGR